MTTELNKQEVIKYLTNLSIDDLGDILMEAGGFRNAQVDKEQVENDNNVVLDYEEYDGVDYCDVFVFPRNNDNLIW
jgi:hypothetical protein